MHEVKTNLLGDNLKPQPKTGFFFFGRVFAASIAFLALGASLASFAIAAKNPKETSILDNIPVISQIRGFFGSKANGPKSDNTGRTNILLLGVGGYGHEGPQLSDTILLVSLDREDKKVGIISIPRDLSVEIPGYGERKINSANAYGEEKGQGEGPKLAAQVAESVFGMPVHYYVRVDFNAFQSIIDQIGGVDINVDRAFTDSQYPTNDYGVETISFNAGWQHMDGQTALKYSRSRHGTGGEGSDFARSARQQKILNAVK
ncbi:MAG: LCP family protein, partial [bacterium]